MKYSLVFWTFVAQFLATQAIFKVDYDDYKPIKYKQNPAPDGHRCGVCPTYFQKVCAFDVLTNSTFIFDNRCVMDLYNCIEGSEFHTMNYQHCVFFGNFAYVHGFRYEDRDYGEDRIFIKDSAKNPDFVRRVADLDDGVFDFSDF